MPLIACLLWLLFGSVALAKDTPPVEAAPIAEAAEATSYIPKGHVLGVVEIPVLIHTDIHGEPVEEARQKEPRGLPLYLKPELNRSPDAWLKNTRELVTTAFDYEDIGAVVYGVHEGWYLIEAQGKKWWIASGSAGAFYSYADMIGQQLSFLRVWDGVIWPSAGGQTAPTVIANYAGKKELPLEVLAWNMVEGRPWMQVRIFDRSPCMADGEPKIVAEGWLPGYQPSGETTFWFYPRGC